MAFWLSIFFTSGCAHTRSNFHDRRFGYECDPTYCADSMAFGLMDLDSQPSRRTDPDDDYNVFSLLVPETGKN